MSDQKQPQPFTLQTPQLGRLLYEDQPRDAVHIAVIPVVAESTLLAGWRCAVKNNGKVAYLASKPKDVVVGIVDPYLTVDVEAGQRFWLFLLPGEVTSLRHEWDNAAFPYDEASKNSIGKDKSASELWLRQYAARVKPYEVPEEAYDNLIREIEDGILYYNGVDLHNRIEVIDEEEFLHHAEIVLGRRLDFDNFEFSCSC